ncbi:PREDICTED: mediator of RNA polymerase II transcription subunit 28 [Chaetura pelagica]|uniref:mediator of RNA polymerase II transcription subunit 28 n=1 Tax=Chaetura pelagica TaxID=8897 RepID=UPI0005231CD3|nr:PREDICTED: mediator of RNA polymerase II transcription subunit 28 [Chaetura pelagica]
MTYTVLKLRRKFCEKWFYNMLTATSIRLITTFVESPLPILLCLGVDQCIQKFLDVARQTECFFLQKRLQLSVQKPEQVIKEDVSELRNELQRKEALIQKHLGKLRHWQQVLEDISVQHKKPAEMSQGPLAYLEQASANIPAPMKQT